MALKKNTDFHLIESIAEAFGHMARNSPVSHVDFVECELNRALEWLRGEQPHRRLAACAVLQQLAENAPTIFFARTKEFFDLVWGPLWDSREKIRLCAAKALSACLAVLRQRTYHLQWLVIFVKVPIFIGVICLNQQLLSVWGYQLLRLAIPNRLAVSCNRYCNIYDQIQAGLQRYVMTYCVYVLHYGSGFRLILLSMAH